MDRGIKNINGANVSLKSQMDHTVHLYIPTINPGKSEEKKMTALTPRNQMQNEDSIIYQGLILGGKLFQLTRAIVKYSFSIATLPRIALVSMTAIFIIVNMYEL